MSVHNNCENCWSQHRQFFPAAVIAPDGQKLCLACVRVLEVDIEQCDPIAEARPATEAEFAQRAGVSAREKSNLAVKEVAENRQSTGALSPPRPLNPPERPKQAPTSNEEKPGVETRNCENPECGKPFTPVRKDSTCCSKKCNGRKTYLKAHGWPEEAATEDAPKRRAPRKKHAAVRNGKDAGELASAVQATPELEERNRVLEAQLEKMVDLQWAGLPLDRKVAALTRELSMAD